MLLTHIAPMILIASAHASCGQPNYPGVYYVDAELHAGYFIEWVRACPNFGHTTPGPREAIIVDVRVRFASTGHVWYNHGMEEIQYAHGV
jgi:hypothetical protein